MELSSRICVRMDHVICDKYKCMCCTLQIAAPAQLRLGETVFSLRKNIDDTKQLLICGAVSGLSVKHISATKIDGLALLQQDIVEARLAAVA